MGLFGDIGSIFGLGGNPENATFQAGTTDLEKPVTPDQTKLAYQQAQDSLTQQQQLAQALAAQGGIGNQSNVYNQLGQVAAGQGPNPAQAMLNQATGTNVANQAALMAGQRGAGANAGLIARQAAMQGSNAQQQALGQAATMQAQQQLGALGQMGGLASQQVAQQMQGQNAYNQLTQNEQLQLLNATNQLNAQKVAMQSNMNSANVAMARANAANGAQSGSGLLNAGGGALGFLGKALGNIKVGSGGGGSDSVGASGSELQATNIGEGTTTAGESYNSPGSPSLPAATSGTVTPTYVAHGGMIKMPPHLADMAKVYHGYSYGGMSMKQGGHVPGKAEVKGDSLKNDVVPARLSPGEIVIPRSITMGKNPEQEAAKFVAKALAEHGKGKKEDHHGDFKAALNRAISGRKKK